MFKDANRVYGVISCAPCEQMNKDVKMTIASKNIKGKICWTLSNFQRHLTNAHKLKRVSTVTQTGKHQPISNNESALLKSPAADSEELANQTLIELDISKTSLLESDISGQISSQILRTHSDNNFAVTQMFFENRNETRSVDVVEIVGDGDCLLGAIIHQLHVFPLSSDEHKKAVTELRAEVVDYIRANMNIFEHEIKGRIYHERSRKKIEGKIQQFLPAANEFLDQNLSQSGYWCGTETLKAVYMKYRVNVAIIDEESSIRFPHKFESQYEKCLLLAYRLNSFQDICSWNRRG